MCGVFKYERELVEKFFIHSIVEPDIVKSQDYKDADTHKLYVCVSFLEMCRKKTHCQNKPNYGPFIAILFIFKK